MPMPAVRLTKIALRREQRVIFVDHRLELIEERLALLQPAAGQIGRRAADA